MGHFLFYQALEAGIAVHVSLCQLILFTLMKAKFI